MKFWASSETFIEVDDSVELCRRLVESYLNEKLDTIQLNNLQLKIRYVPIVMPKCLISKYPERSICRIRSMIYDCAPQLDYETFLNGSSGDKIQEYVRGIFSSVPHLFKFGATTDQVKTFEFILINGQQRILNNLRRIS
jgi:hypothetical protein